MSDIRFWNDTPLISAGNFTDEVRFLIGDPMDTTTPVKSCTFEQLKEQLGISQSDTLLMIEEDIRRFSGCPVFNSLVGTATPNSSVLFYNNELSYWVMSWYCRSVNNVFNILLPFGLRVCYKRMGYETVYYRLRQNGVLEEEDYINDPNYVHTDNNFTTELKQKVERIFSKNYIMNGTSLSIPQHHSGSYPCVLAITEAGKPAVVDVTYTENTININTKVNFRGTIILKY